MTEVMEPSRYTKDQLKVIALRQRIGEITANYEEQIADMRATITQEQEVTQETLQNQHKEIQRLQGELSALQKEEPDKKSAK